MDPSRLIVMASMRWEWGVAWQALVERTGGVEYVVGIKAAFTDLLWLTGRRMATFGHE